MALRPITEYLAIDLDKELWVCRRCSRELGSARRNYKEGLLLRARDPREIHSSGSRSHALRRIPSGAAWSRCSARAARRSSRWNTCLRGTRSPTTSRSTSTP